MEQFYATAIFIMVLSFFWYVISFFIKPKSKDLLPPEPLGFPVVGYLPFLPRNLPRKFTELVKKYGPIYKLHLGKKLCVVISSPSLAKEVVRDHDMIFSNRDLTVAAQVVTHGGNDIVFSPSNSSWQLLRKNLVQETQSSNSLHASRNLRKEEVRKTIRNVFEKAEKPIDVGDLGFVTEINVIMNMVWGGTFGGEEGERLTNKFKEVVPKLIDLVGKPNLSDFFPVLARFDVQGVKKEIESHLLSAEEIFDIAILRCKEKLSRKIASEGRKDLLQMILELQQKGDPDLLITDKQLKSMLLDVVFGGTDTSATTIEWAMAELLDNPRTLEKAQKELWEIVGMSNIVEESHLSKLQYLDAIVKETLRLHPAIPLLIPKSPSETVNVGGYIVPKGTCVFLNVWAMQRDPFTWENPLEFKPERFINENEGLSFGGNNFQYMPFGSGRRMCAGMPLAKRMVAYLLGSLLHTFDWKLIEGERNMTENFTTVLRKSTSLIAIPSPRLSTSDLYA